jgi:thiol-disulfide isomerase/thioredoxin
MVGFSLTGKCLLAISLFDGAASPQPALAEAPSAVENERAVLSIGDAAPPVHVRTWVKGTPIAPALEKGKVYVIDIWSTWCIPCVASMPHTTELQKRFQDSGLVALGVTSRDSFGNTEEAIRDLVKRKGDSIGFAIGIDEESESAKGYLGVFRGKTVEAYLGGARVQAIPVAFVVDRQGRIAFIGHPMEIDEAVQKCLDGTWDLELARKQRQARMKAQGLLEQLQTAILAKDLDRGLALCRQIVVEVPHGESRLFAAVAAIMSEGDGALAKRDRELALEAGKKGVELTKSRDPGMLSALASVYFAQGQTDKAIETKARAVALAEGGMKEVLEKELAKYRSAASKP